MILINSPLRTVYGLKLQIKIVMVNYRDLEICPTPLGKLAKKQCVIRRCGVVWAMGMIMYELCALYEIVSRCYL